MTDLPMPDPEFSRPVSTSRLSAAGATYRIAARAEERAALARRFGLVSLDRLEAEVRLHRVAAEIRLEADLSADLVQSCVVTMEPVPAALGETFALRYRAGIDEDEADRLALEHPEDEIIEPLIAESIDIGEAVAQQLSVAMDPYPRVSGAPATSGEVPIGKSDAFDGLAVLKKRP
jgi:hypothetical protein